MDNLQQNSKSLSASDTQGLVKSKQDIYSGLNLLSESEINSLKKFLKETVAEINKQNGVKYLGT